MRQEIGRYLGDLHGAPRRPSGRSSVRDAPLLRMRGCRRVPDACMHSMPAAPSPDPEKRLITGMPRSNAGPTLRPMAGDGGQSAWNGRPAVRTPPHRSPAGRRMCFADGSDTCGGSAALRSTRMVCDPKMARLFGYGECIASRGGSPSCIAARVKGASYISFAGTPSCISIVWGWLRKGIPWSTSFPCLVRPHAGPSRPDTTLCSIVRSLLPSCHLRETIYLDAVVRVNPVRSR